MRIVQKWFTDKEIINEEEARVGENEVHVRLSKFNVLVYETPETCVAESRLVGWEGLEGKKEAATIVN